MHSNSSWSVQMVLNTNEEIWYSGPVCKMYENGTWLVSN